MRAVVVSIGSQRCADSEQLGSDLLSFLKSTNGRALNRISWLPVPCAISQPVPYGLLGAAMRLICDPSTGSEQCLVQF